MTLWWESSKSLTTRLIFLLYYISWSLIIKIVSENKVFNIIPFFFFVSCNKYSISKSDTNISLFKRLENQTPEPNIKYAAWFLKFVSGWLNTFCSDFFFRLFEEIFLQGYFLNEFITAALYLLLPQMKVF